MKRLLCLLLLVASSAEAAYHVKAWKPAGESRFILQCIADAVIDLPTCASVSDGFDCRVLAMNAIYICDGASWSAVGGGGISDGDKGDITVSSSGAAWAVDPNSVDLGTDTVGGYAGSSSEGGAATSALAVTGFSASKCARFDGSGNLVAASGDCTAGDTTGSGAPTTADYLVKTADGGLSAERVVTDTATVTWDWATGGQAKATAVDLACTGCLGGTEIDESSLGTVPTATSATTAATASALATNPTPCTSGDFVTDIAADGTLTCATPSGGSGLTHPQVMARLAIGGGY